MTRQPRPRRLPEGFLGPWWLERQRDLAGDDFEPADTDGDINRSHRDAVLVGNLDSPDRLAVDPRGLVVGPSGSWSVDWWIGGDQRWHLPSREGAVRQELLSGTPVVVTAIRVPGGDAIQRVYSVESVSGVEAIRGPAAIVEIENASPVPVAVALAVRPYGIGGLGEITEVGYRGGDGCGVVTVDGADAVVFSKEPARFALGDARADSAETVLRGAARSLEHHDMPQPMACTDGLAQGAFVFPLPHTAVLRAFVALPSKASFPQEHAAARSAPRAEPVVPRAETVSKGWEAHAGRRARIDLPDPRLHGAIAGARHGLLLGLTGDESALDSAAPREYGHGDRGVEQRRAEARHDVLSALQEFGFGDEAETVLVRVAADRAPDGRLGGGRSDDVGVLVAHAATLGLLARQIQLGDGSSGGDSDSTHDLARALTETAAAAGLWLGERTSARGRRFAKHRSDRWTGLARPEGPDEAPSFATQFWVLHGLDALAALFASAGEPGASLDARRAREELALAVDEAMEASLGVARLLPALAGGPFDTDAVQNLVAAELDLPEASRPWFTRLRGHVADSRVSGAVPDPGGRGLSPRETIRLARAELSAGEQQATASPLRWLTGGGSHPGWWPTAVNPRTGGGSAGEPADLGVSAAFLLLARELVVGEHAKGLDLLRVFPDGWLGQNVEVHGLPTRWGTVSYAIRWHGDRPALLWEVAGRSATPIELRCPGLDPSWSTTDPAGDVLLAAVEPRGDEEGVGDLGGEPPGAAVDGAGAVGVSLRVAAPTRKTKPHRSDAGPDSESATDSGDRP